MLRSAVLEGSLKPVFVALFLFLFSFAASSQTPQPGSQDYVASSITWVLQDKPQPVALGSISATRLDNPGPCPYYYWVVARFTIGNAAPSGPAAITNGACTLTNGNRVGWSAVTGATGYDVLRTSNQFTPVGACNCAIATNVSSTTATDTGLNAYTIVTFVPSVFNIVAANEQASAGKSRLNFRLGGVTPIFTINSDGSIVFASLSVNSLSINGGAALTDNQGNGTKVQHSTGATTTNHAVKYDLNGNTVDGGGPLPATKTLLANQFLNSYDALTGLFTSQTNGPLPATKALVANQFFNSYDAGTGLFTAAQPNGHALLSSLGCSALSGSSTTYTCTTSPSFTPVVGDTVVLNVDVGNSGASTLNVNAAGAFPIRRQGGGTPLLANDLLAGEFTVVSFDGARWQMIGQTGNPVPVTIPFGGPLVLNTFLTGYDSTTGIFSSDVLGAHHVSVALECQAASASGTAYTCATSPTFVPVSGDSILLRADVASGVAPTLNVNATAASPIKKQGGGAALTTNDFRAGQWSLLTFDGTNWQMQGQLGNAATGASVQGTANKVQKGGGAGIAVDSSILDDGALVSTPEPVQAPTFQFPLGSTIVENGAGSLALTAASGNLLFGFFRVNASGRVLLYDAITTASNTPGLVPLYGVPIIVQGQTIALPATNVYAAAPVGLYRVSGYLVLTGAGTSGTISVNIVYTDEEGAQTFVAGTTGSIGLLGGKLPFSATIRSDGGAQDIQVSTTFNTVIGVPTYSIYAVTERLMRQ